MTEPTYLPDNEKDSTQSDRPGVTGKDVPISGELRMADLPRLGSTHLRDLVRTREDIRDLREEFYKPTADLARSMGYNVTVTDLLPLTAGNDPLYIRDSNYRDARWLAAVFGDLNEEGRLDLPEHARSLHYLLVGDDLVIPKYDPEYPLRYQSSNKHWSTLQSAAKYARILGLIDPETMKDEKNDPPDGPVATFEDAGRYIEKPSVPSESDIDRHPFVIRPSISFSKADLPSEVDLPRLDERDPTTLDTIVDRMVGEIVSEAFHQFRAVAERRQQYYVEIWAEKSGIIPREIRHRYPGVSFRPAEGGEFSETMCRQAVGLAKQRGQDLIVVILSDRDPKGADMPKSISRKIEVEAALDEEAKGSHGPPIDAIVEHAALTPDQVAEYDLPSAPIDTDSQSYRGHAALLNDLQVEINALASLRPEALLDAINDAIAPYYDRSLDERIDEAVEAERERLRTELRAKFDERSKELRERHDEVDSAVEEYYDYLRDDVEEMSAEFAEVNERIHELREEYLEREADAREKAGLDDALGEFDDKLAAVGYRWVLAEFDIDLPKPELGTPDLPILDTRRTIGQQLDVYRFYDVRYETADE